MDPDIQKRIDQLYADMKPLMDHFGIKPRTIDERYANILRRRAEESKPKPTGPRFKLPKL
jgi:hypothetical protein